MSKLFAGVRASFHTISAPVPPSEQRWTADWTDGAVMYMWPVLWMSHFYGRRGTVFIAAWVGVVHGLALAAMPAAMGNADRWVDVTVSVAVVGAVVRALSERSDRLVARLVAEARADTLTGLLNRRGFEERLAAEVARATRERTSLALVSLDLDHFKRVNDEQGHEAGDRALAMVGAVIADHVRGADLAARWGGEEFVVVLPGADAAMYAAKRTGRDRTVVADGGAVAAA